MRALILDAGNTRITCAAWEGAGQVPVPDDAADHGLAPPVPLFDLGSLELPDSLGLAEFHADFTRMHTECGRPPVVLVSVVPEIAGMLPEGLDLRVADHASELPFTLDVVHPEQVGPDRLCNVAAAAASGLANALVVDAGTATTFDLLVAGAFIGGMIAPGMASSADCLGERAARLDPVPFGPAGWEAGDDTRSAMGAGAWHAGIGGVRYTVEGILDRYGPLPVILTGGLGVFLRDFGWYFDPHWTLRGAAILSKA